jgi:hypothetical protein
MVRWVFRPYTQLGRAICTSTPQRSSTRVSPGFNLSRHSSPSFGSQQVYFTSNPFPVNQDRAVLRPQGLAHLPFSAAYGFDTLSLAHVLDSLVRVSRRVVQDRYV